MGIFCRPVTNDTPERVKPFKADPAKQERLRSSLWLQFIPHHIAAKAAYLATKILNFDLATHHGMWQKFQTTPSICQDVVKQLTELF
ncbi:hypothetical protein IFM89_004614 [Coptis chinensis]|uniref:Uncharacterized protein n=1 Tax=Coptis chinensis TaxID=261450 RepID=A0A835H1F7_9MAGN|nr:hypothetical protein IFM89_004614 [Coptis chinensis]